MPGARPGLWHERRGEGGPVLLFLHGLGASAEVWRGAADLAGRWPGSVVLVDLPGHGRSDPLDRYSYEAHALALRSLLGDLPAPLVVAGHSMGGAIGILLGAERFGLDLAAVVGIGIKASWSQDDLDGMGRRALQPPRRFGTREEAAARYLRSVGLDGAADPDGPVAASGIAKAGGGWRLAFDPAANQVGRPDLAGWLAGTRAAVTLARGSGDQMVATADLKAPGCETVELPGLGHNAHFEDPGAAWALISSAARRAGLP